MSTNQEMLQVIDESIRKDVFGNADLSTGGLLNPEQADRFIQKLFDYAIMTQDFRKVTMTSPKRRIEKLNFANRIAVAPGAEGVDPASGDIKKPTTEKVELSTVEVDAYVDLAFTTVEDNIERGNLENTIVDMVARRLQTDLEELYLKGDTGSGDTYLALLNGWLKQSTSNVVDVSSATFSEDGVFGAMLDSLPQRFFRNPNEWRLYTSTKNVRKVRRERAARQTIGGDFWLTGSPPLTYEDVAIVGVPLMADSKCLLIHPDNVLIGIQRDITFDNFRNGRKRIWQMTWTMRVDTKYEEETAVVSAINIA